MISRRWTLMLATGASGTALSLSILAGWQRGGSLPERIVWVAIGVVLVVSAHLLPALIRDGPLTVRGTGVLLWGACLATACYGHAVFFVTAQQHAGELRASTVLSVLPSSSGRSLTVVMSDRASATAQLASVNARRCAGNCKTREARRVTLAARLDALNAEAGEVRRNEAERDQVMMQRDALRADPVTSRLAVLLGTTASRVDLLTGLAFAAVLEGVACLLWTVALRSSLPPTEPVATGAASAVLPAVTVTADATQCPVTTVAVSRDGATSSHAPRGDPTAPLPVIAPVDDDLTQLDRDIAAGRVRPTVADIRRHLGCSQARAIALRRQLAERNVTA